MDEIKLSAAKSAFVGNAQENIANNLLKNETLFDGEFGLADTQGVLFGRVADNQSKAKKLDTSKITQEPKLSKAEQKEADKAAKAKADKLIKQAKKDKTGAKISVNGNKITITDKSGKKTVQTIGPNGKVSLKTVTEGKGDNKKVTTSKYDKNGKKTDAVITLGSGANKSTKVVKYKNGEKTYSITQQGNQTVKRDFKDGHMTKKVETTGNGKNAQTVTTDYAYDKKGNLTSTNKVGKDGTITKKEYSNYKTNKDGSKTRDVKMSVTKPNGKTTNYTEKHKINKEGYLESKEKYNADGKKVQTVENKYNKNNQITGKTVVNYKKDGSTTKSVYSGYKYSNNLRTMSTATFNVKTTTTTADGKSTKDTKLGTKGIDGRNTITEAKASLAGSIGKAISKIGDWISGGQSAELTDIEDKLAQMNIDETIEALESTGFGPFISSTLYDPNLNAAKLQETLQKKYPEAMVIELGDGNFYVSKINLSSERVAQEKENYQINKDLIKASHDKLLKNTTKVVTTSFHGVGVNSVIDTRFMGKFTKEDIEEVQARIDEQKNEYENYEITLEVADDYSSYTIRTTIKTISMIPE